MARQLRIEFPGAVYHITSRGNAKQPVFLDDGDRKDFLDRLCSVVRRSNWLGQGSWGMEMEQLWLYNWEFTTVQLAEL